MNLTKTIALLWVILSPFTVPHELKAQNELKVLHQWKAYKDAPDALYNHISTQAIDYLKKRAAEVGEIQSLSEWEQRQAGLRENLADILGPFPNKTALNARVIRTIDKKQYKVEHIIFESQPGFYVTSSLYIPAGLTRRDKAPAIIYCSGHTPLGYRSEAYQHVILNLVQKGFVVFTFDPVGQGERLEYFDPEKGSSIVGGPTREHAFPGAQLFLSGNSLARYMIWDGIRAVDYLLTRREVDPSRIGITGRSGGGTQSAYIAALDERIYAVAPENYITNFTRLLQTIGAQDAEQNFVNGIARGLDHADLLAVRAPKPALMLTTANDMFSLQGARETAGEVVRIYHAYEKAEHFLMVEDTGGHISTQKNREAMYAFFQKHLNHPGNARDEEVSLLTEEEMQVTATGQISTTLKGETLFSLNKKETEQLNGQLQTSRSDLVTHLPKAVEAAKQLSGYLTPAAVDAPVFTGNVQREDYVIEKYFVKGEGDYVLPYLLFVPDQPNGQAILYVHPSGKAAEAGHDGEIAWFVKQGFTVLAPDMLGTGEIGSEDLSIPNYFSHAAMEGVSYEIWNAAMMIRRSIVGIRAGDVVRLTKVLKNHPEITDIFALARGKMAPVLLHAAAFEPAISRIALISPLTSYRSMVMQRFYQPDLMENAVPASLTAYDLPDLAASLAPRKLLLLNVMDGTGNPANAESIAQDVAVIKAAYGHKNVEGQLMIETGTSDENAYEHLEEWIR